MSLGISRTFSPIRVRSDPGKKKKQQKVKLTRLASVAAALRAQHGPSLVVADHIWQSDGWHVPGRGLKEMPERMPVASAPGVVVSQHVSTSMAGLQALVCAGGCPLPRPSPPCWGSQPGLNIVLEVPAAFGLLEGFAWPRPRPWEAPSSRHLHMDGAVTCRPPPHATIPSYLLTPDPVSGNH